MSRKVAQVRPADEDLDRMAEMLAAATNITIYGGAGCQGAHSQIVALAARLNAPIAHTTRARDALEYANPYNVGMTQREDASFRDTCVGKHAKARGASKECQARASRQGQ